MPDGLGFRLVLASVVVAVVASHLVGLASSPPGFFSDEAAFAYNGWTIAHFGVDQFGIAHPLLFRSFGDYKGPVGVYSEALVMAFLPLTPFTARLPNAVAGIALSLVAGLLGWRVTGSRVVAVVLILEAAFEPWFFHLSRPMLEADIFAPLCYTVALAALVRGGEKRVRNCAVAGVALAVGPLTAQPGRFFTVVVVVLLVAAYRKGLDLVRAALVAVPALLTTGIILTATSQATARFSAVSVFSGASFREGAAQAVSNYLQYFSPSFLFIRGDPNIRHATGFEGMLFASAAVPLVLGTWWAIRRRREPVARVALAGLLLAPVGAALTVGLNARRDMVVLPFLLLLLAFGWNEVAGFARDRRVLAVAAVPLVLLAAVPYYVDYALAYPPRAAHDFETGLLDAITRAHAEARGHEVLLYHGDFDPQTIALAAFRPSPYAADPLAGLRMRVVENPADLAGAAPGDLLVLSTLDPPPPPGAALLFDESVQGRSSIWDGTEVRVTLVRVYRAS